MNDLRPVLAAVIAGKTQRSFASFTDRAAHLLLDDTAQRLQSISSASGFARIAHPKSSGKWYLEFLVFSPSTTVPAVRIGLAKPSASNAFNLGEDGSNSIGLDESGQELPTTDFIEDYIVPGRVTVGMAWNADTGSVWWSIDGVFPNGGNPSTGANPHSMAAGAHHAAVSIYEPAIVVLRQPTQFGGAFIGDERADPLRGFNMGWWEDSAATYFIASEDYISWPDDDAPYANRLFEGVIANDPEYDRAITNVIWDGGAQRKSTIGAVELLNYDGQLDSWSAVDWRNLQIRMYLGYAGAAFRDFELVAESLIDRLDRTDVTRPKFFLIDRTAELATAVQTNLYDALTPVVELRGKTKPLTLGRCNYVPMQRFDALLELYRVNDGTSAAFIELLDRGISITNGVGWASMGAVDHIKRLTNPAGRQVMTTSGSLNSAGLMERLPDLMAYLLSTRATIPANCVSRESLDYLDRLLPFKSGIHVAGSESRTVRDVVDRLLDGYLASMWTDRYGRINVQGLQAPAAVADFVLSDLELLAEPRDEFDAAKGLSDSVEGVPNYGVHGDSDIAASILLLPLADRLRSKFLAKAKGSSVLHSAYASAVGASPIATVLSDAGDVQLLADHVTALYSVERRNYYAQAWIDRAFALQIGQTVYFERFDKNLLVVGARSRWLSGAVDLRLWG